MNTIAENVSQLELLPRNGINAYLIGDVLIDTGLKQSAGKIAGMLAGRDISAIALTHAHGDHAGAMKQLAGRLGVPIWCGAGDREAVESGRVVLTSKLDRPVLGTIFRAGADFEGAPVARVLSEGDELTAGFTVLETPGHSPGHISFWREEDRTLICGDVFFNMNIFTTIPGLHEPLALVTPDPVQNRLSERRLAGLEPKTVGFGHGPVMRDDAARKLSEFVAA